MTSRQIQYIITTYEEGSISKAAQKLFVSQPALSQSIQLVERELGAPIFDRRHSPLTLTYAGERYVAAAMAFQQLELNLQHEISDIQNEQCGWFRVGISMLHGATLLPKILPQFMEKYPRVEMKIVEKGSNSLAPLLTQNLIDIAFLTTDIISQKQMVMIPLCHVQTYLCAGMESELAQTVKPGTPVSIHLLENAPLVTIKVGHGLHEIQNKIFSDLNTPPKVLFEVESAVLAMQLTACCNAMMLCPRLVMPALSNPSIALYPLIEEDYSRELVLCYKHDTYLSAYMKDFIELAKSSITDEMI